MSQEDSSSKMEEDGQTPSSDLPSPTSADSVDVIEFPVNEFLAAIAEERDARDYAFLGLNHSICGIDVVPMTLRQVLTRMMINCPLLTGERLPEPEEIAAFLWFLSPEFSATDSEARKHFTARVAAIPYSDALAGIREYLDLMFLDAPPASGKGQNRVPRTSIAATFIDIFAGTYGWSRNEILDTSLPILYGLIREIQQRTNSKAIFFNKKSDRVRSRYLKRLAARNNAKRQALSAKPKPEVSQ